MRKTVYVYFDVPAGEAWLRDEEDDAAYPENFYAWYEYIEGDEESHEAALSEARETVYYLEEMCRNIRKSPW